MSKERAPAVATWLTEHGIAAGRLATRGHGSADPLKTGNSPADQQASRRVTVTIYTKA